MIQVKGTYNTAKVFTDNLNSAEHNEIKNICNSALFIGCNIAIMPDVSYAGKYCLVGFTQTRGKYLLAQVLGSDIACGVTTFKTNIKDVNLVKTDLSIQALFSGEKVYRYGFSTYLSPIVRDMLRKINMPESVYLDQLLTIGGGNHFFELNRDKEGFIYITIHSGSRHLGGCIYKYFTKNIEKKVFDSKTFEEESKKIREKYSGQEISVKISELNKYCTSNVPEYVEDVDEYIRYMELANDYSSLNRKLIAEYVERNILNCKITDSIESVHNYYDTKHNILRKGAISAQLNERIVIPLNMAEGIVVASGKGNPEYNYSCPHGLGRNVSRSQSKKEITLEDFQNSMTDVYSTCVNESTIDESPMAYKSYEEVFSNVKDTIEIIEILKPILNIKGV